MAILLEEAKRKLISTKYRHAGEQEDDLISLLKAMGEHQKDLLRWEFVEHQNGFVDPRKRAGLIFMSQWPNETWALLEKLIRDPNPDDRDVACEILMEIGGERASQLIKLLLRDPYPYLQFQACDYLLDTFLTDVTETLGRLSHHELNQVQMQARARLDMISKRTIN